MLIRNPRYYHFVDCRVGTIQSDYIEQHPACHHRGHHRGVLTTTCSPSRTDRPGWQVIKTIPYLLYEQNIRLESGTTVGLFFVFSLPL